LVALLAGCATNTQSPTAATASLAPVIVESLSQAEAEGIDEFSAEVLQEVRVTGEISEADWKQANNNWIACVASLGASGSIEYQGTHTQYTVAVPPELAPDTAGANAVMDSVDRLCTDRNRWVNIIYDLLYRASWKSDPRQVDERVIACLQERGLAPDSLTYEELEADIDAGDASRYGPSSSEAVAACWQENS
jgi:hypothetical protein